MHDLAVGANDIGREHKEREQERIALPLLVGSLPRRLVAIRASLVVLVVVFAIIVVVAIYGVESQVEEIAQGEPCECAQRTSCDEAEKASYPFSCSHMERRISFLGLPAFWQPHDLQKYKKSGKWENVSQKSDEEWTCFDNYCVILWPIKIYLRN